MVGRLTEEKRFIDGFQALALLRTQWPNLRLRLVGGGTMFGELQALRRSLQLEEAIEMTDFVPPPRVRGYIDAASIVLVPSRYESFGLVALDAAMRGRPVVASDVMGLKEVVVRGKTGLLVAPESPNLIAEAVDLLLSDPARMVAIGRHAADRAWEQFSIQTTARQYLEMYNRVVCSVG
jgi:glycosyltransferase involved in cell wall biosynthesis